MLRQLTLLSLALGSVLSMAKPSQAVVNGLDAYYYSDSGNTTMHYDRRTPQTLGAIYKGKVIDPATKKRYNRVYRFFANDAKFNQHGVLHRGYVTEYGHGEHCLGVVTLSAGLSGDNRLDVTYHPSYMQEGKCTVAGKTFKTNIN